MMYLKKLEHYLEQDERIIKTVDKKNRNNYNGYYLTSDAIVGEGVIINVMNAYHPEYTVNSFIWRYIESEEIMLRDMKNFILKGNKYYDFYTKNNLDEIEKITEFKDKCELLSYIANLHEDYFHRINVQFRFKDNKLSKLLKDCFIVDITPNEIFESDSKTSWGELGHFNLNDIKYLEITYKRRIYNYIKVRYNVPEIDCVSDETYKMFLDAKHKINRRDFDRFD